MAGLTKQVPEFFNAQQFEQGSNLGHGDMAAGFQRPGLGVMTDAAQMYRNQAMGLSPSVANLQMQQGIEQNNRAALGLMGAQRGGNIGGAYSQALGAQSGANLATSQQAAINRLAEQQAAMSAYAGLGGQMSQMGLGYAGLGQSAYDAMQNRDLEWRLGKRGLDLQEKNMDRQFWQGIATAGIGAVGGALGAATGAGAGGGG